MLADKKLLNKLKSGDCCVLVCPRDSNDEHTSYGALVIETYIDQSSILDALSSRSRFASLGYGQICRLVPVTDDEVGAALAKV